MNMKLLKTIKFTFVCLLFTILLYRIYISYLKALQLLNKHSYSCFSWNAFPPHYLFQSYKMVVYCFTLCNILAYVVSYDVIKHIFQNTLVIQNAIYNLNRISNISFLYVSVQWYAYSSLTKFINHFKQLPTYIFQNQCTIKTQFNAIWFQNKVTANSNLTSR